MHSWNKSLDSPIKYIISVCTPRFCHLPWLTCSSVIWTWPVSVPVTAMFLIGCQSAVSTFQASNLSVSHFNSCRWNLWGSLARPEVMQLDSWLMKDDGALGPIWGSMTIRSRSPFWTNHSGARGVVEVPSIQHKPPVMLGEKAKVGLKLPVPAFITVHHNQGLEVCEKWLKVLYGDGVLSQRKVGKEEGKTLSSIFSTWIFDTQRRAVERVDDTALSVDGPFNQLSIWSQCVHWILVSWKLDIVDNAIVSTPFHDARSCIDIEDPNLRKINMHSMIISVVVSHEVFLVIRTTPSSAATPASFPLWLKQTEWITGGLFVKGKVWVGRKVFKFQTVTTPLLSDSFRVDIAVMKTGSTGLHLTSSTLHRKAQGVFSYTCARI